MRVRRISNFTNLINVITMWIGWWRSEAFSQSINLLHVFKNTSSHNYVSTSDNSILLIEYYKQMFTLEVILWWSFNNLGYLRSRNSNRNRLKLWSSFQLIRERKFPQRYKWVPRNPMIKKLAYEFSDFSSLKISIRNLLYFHKPFPPMTMSSITSSALLNQLSIPHICRSWRFSGDRARPNIQQKILTHSEEYLSFFTGKQILKLYM